MSEWAWVVGGGILQSYLVSEYQRRGLRVVVTDANPNCYCADIADEVWEISTYNWAGHLMAAHMVEESPPRAVATAGTDVGDTVSEVAAVFGLPACTPEAAHRAKNKYQMRRALALPHPRYAGFTASETCEWPWTYPCIVKPCDASASRGVEVVFNEVALAAACERARAWNHHSEFVLVEEHLGEGAVVSVDFMVVEDEPVYVNGALRYFEGALEVGYTNPWIAPPEVSDLAAYACARLGVREGPFKMDLIEHPEYGWTLLECTTRWSGAFDHAVAARLATGRDLTRMLAQYTLGERVDFPAYALGSPVQVCTPLLEPGTDVLSAADHYHALPEVVEVIPTREVARKVECAADRPLFVFFRAGEWRTL